MIRRAPLVLVLALGCALPVKVGELEGTSGDPSTTIGTTFAQTSETGPSESSSGDPPPPPSRHDYAIRFADLPETGDTSGDGGSSAEGSTGGDPFDPDSLVITMSIGEDTCEDPYGGLPCGDRWKVTFNLPPALQLVGATGALDEHNGFVLETGPDVGGDCSGGGGTISGAFEITAIDPTRVAGRLTALELVPFDETELDFDAARCGS